MSSDLGQFALHQLWDSAKPEFPYPSVEDFVFTGPWTVKDGGPSHPPKQKLAVDGPELSSPTAYPSLEQVFLHKHDLIFVCLKEEKLTSKKSVGDRSR